MSSFNVLLKQKHRQFVDLILDAARKLDNGSSITIPEWSTQEIGENFYDCSICGIASFIRVSETGKQAARKRINVHLKGQMYAFKRNEEIVFKKYKTSVLYCRPIRPSSDNEFKDPVGYHYDFDSNVDPAHPVFHAQQDNTTLIDEVSAQFSSSFPEGSSNAFGSARIPTCQLDFYSAILMIIADHLVDHSESDDVSIFKELIEQCERHWIQPDTGSEREEYLSHLFLRPPPAFCSYNWYCFRK